MTVRRLALFVATLICSAPGSSLKADPALITPAPREIQLAGGSVPLPAIFVDFFTKFG